MARRIKGSRKGKGEAEGDTQVTRRGSGLEEPFPSSPTRPPNYVLYCTNHESDRRYIVNACALYAIRKIFDAIVGENEIAPSPLSETTMTFGEVDIKSDQMSAILNHQYSKAEEEWELGRPYPEQIDNFLHGPRMSRLLEQHPGATGTVTKTESVKREPKPVKERVDRSGMITVQQLASDAGIDPRDARAALRKAKVAKPTGGWLGDEAWAKTIRPVLATAAKELKKKGGK